jgi:uncharacterized membrane protein (UPF0182 family)
MQSRLTRLIILAAVLAVIAGLIAIFVNIYPNLLWFDMVGYVSVYTQILLTKVALGVAVGGFFLVILLVNLYLIWRFTPSQLSPTLIESIPISGEFDFDLRKMVYVVLALLAIAFSALMGYSATDRWEIALRYFNADELPFESATSLSETAEHGTSEVFISQLDVDAKGLQVGDKVVIEQENQSHEASVVSINSASDGLTKITLSHPLEFSTTEKAVLIAPSRDPIFDKNASYYVFRMPFARFICGNLVGLFLLLTLFSAVLYFFHGSLISEKNRFEPQQRVKTHLFVLIGLTLLFRAWNYRFIMYDLLYATNDVVRGGGGYAAIQARLIVLKILLVLSVICALVFLISIFLRRISPAVGGVVILLIVGFFGQVYPSLVQRLKVEPNKQDLEAKYINYNIKATLHAYDLEDNTVTEEEYPLTGELSYEEITNQENTAVINSVRLWDWRPLRRTFRQLQELRRQYDFADVDVDRYPMGNGEPRQVMLSTRELDLNELRREDWFKRTYVYTHGYGAVMSPVNEIVDGKPRMYIKNIPVNYAPEWTKNQFNEAPGPRIYYGELTPNYVIIHPDRNEKLEFDYPEPGQSYAKYSYTGQGGVKLSSFLRRFVYMLKFSNELKFILPGAISTTSRVLYHRNIQERVQKIAPFLRYDKDPYAVIHDGKLIWMIDAYTITRRYPYSAPMPDVMRATIEERQGRLAASRIVGGEQPWDGNYIRNAVKVTVDAYDGTVNFYLMDRENDPIVECYSRMFPNLFKSFDAMPDNLKGHIRYPTTMFLIQARMYQEYHMKDSTTFYAKEDPWEIGKEVYDTTERPRTQPVTPPSPFAAQQAGLQPLISNEQEVAPYYVVIKLPGEEQAEFMLMLPFTPKSKLNLTAWLAARCDLPQYGQLLVYRFPKGKLAPGPMQVENFITQKPEISEQISLWNREGSRVLRGNLLIIPMNNALLYVEPIYIQSENEDSAIPELRRVVIGYKENVVWGASFDEALVKMFGRSVATRSPVAVQSDARSSTLETAEQSRDEADVPAQTSHQVSISELAKDANHYFEQAEAARQAGDWAEYGRYHNLLEQSLKQLDANAQ